MWDNVELEAICSKITDGSHNPPKGIEYSENMMLSSKNVFDDNIHFDKPRFLTCEDFEQENKRTDVSAGDVLLTIVGTIGRVAVYPCDAPKITLQRSVAVLKPKQDIVCPRYIMYALNACLDLLLGKARGVAQKGLYLKTLRKQKIPLPSLEEQKKIVEVLDELFAGIDQAIENTEQNLANAKVLFQSYLDHIFTGKDEYWVDKKLMEVCQLLNGRAYKKSELLSEGKYPVLRVGNFFSNRSWYYSDLELEDKKYCDNGDLLYAWSASFGPRIWEGGKVIYHYHIWKCQLDEAQVNKEFLYYWFDWDSKKIQQEQGAGTTMIHVTKGAMENRSLSLPALKEQKRIVVVLDDISEGKKELESTYKQKLVSLKELKQSLLKKAFAGELTAEMQEAA